MSVKTLSGFVQWREVREIIASYERQIAELKVTNEKLRKKNNKLRRKSHGKEKE